MTRKRSVDFYVVNQLSHHIQLIFHSFSQGFIIHSLISFHWFSLNSILHIIFSFVFILCKFTFQCFKSCVFSYHIYQFRQKVRCFFLILKKLLLTSKFKFPMNNFPSSPPAPSPPPLAGDRERDLVFSLDRDLDLCAQRERE